MFIEVTQRTEATNTNTKAVDLTTVMSAVVGSVMGVVILIIGVVVVVVVRKKQVFHISSCRLYSRMNTSTYISFY